MLIHEQTTCPAFGTYAFTPEGYAKISYWIPEDGFSHDEFPGKSWSSLEEFEAARAEFKEKTSGKTEVVTSIYWDKSLRKLLPNRWTLVYTKDKAWREVDGEKVPLYSQLKRTLYFKTTILGYGDGEIEKLVAKEVAEFIKQHCASSARLKAIALRAYESMANCGGYHTWTPMGQSAYVCLAAAISSLDSMAAVLWALLFNDAPQGRSIPDMADLYRKLWPGRKKGLPNKMPFESEFAELYESKWLQALNEARAKVVHRGASPMVQDQLGIALELDLGIFEGGKSEWRSTPGTASLGPSMELIPLDELMTAFVVELEAWESKVAAKLQAEACFQSSNLDGILLGIKFEDGNLRTDSSGPMFLLRSNS